MSHQPTTNIDESLLINHNIACAASIVASIKGVKPEGPTTSMEMDAIIFEIVEAYKYSIWRFDKYNRHTTDAIVKVRGQSLWNKTSNEQD